jgi:5-methylcytosine-specific restriction enzyme subunit McrC
MSRRPELPPVTVREFARLTTSELPLSTLDRARISPTAFDWLCELSSRKNGQTGAQMLQVESRNWLQLDNHVGVLESPCGQRIEILPKHVEGGGPQTVRQSRSLLRRMLASALDLSPRETDEASLEQFDHPLTEWVMQRFLLALDQLVKRGMRRDYLRVEEMQPYLRGQLDMACQMRTPPGRAHLFSICHDVFSVDRPENRLLKSALSRVMYAAQEAESWRLASTLLCLLDEVPPSRDVAADFKAWRSDRLMAHYEPVRPWCELVLSHQVPLAVAGDTSRRWRARITDLARGVNLPRCAAYTVRRSASKNSSLCRRSPWVWAATRAARSALTGASGRPVLCASTWAWQARSR